MWGGGGGGRRGWSSGGAWFRFRPLDLKKIHGFAGGRRGGRGGRGGGGGAGGGGRRGGQGRGCFACKPCFTLTLSDSILSDLIPKNTRENRTIFGVSCSRKYIFSNFPVG